MGLQKRAQGAQPEGALLLRLTQGALVVGIAVVALFAIGYACRPLAASDIFWQVRTGELALDTGSVPSVDSFSYTIHGHPWNNHEWLFEIAAALLYRAFGWVAFRIVVTVLFVGALFAIALRVWTRAGAGGALLVAALELIFAAYKAQPVPQLVSMVLFLGALALFRGRSLVTSPRLPVLLALYLLLWGNLTAEVLTFLPFLLIDQLCLRRRRDETRVPLSRVAVALFVLALLAPLVNPPWASTLDYALNGTAVNRVVNSEFAHLWEPANAIDPPAKNIAIALVLLYLPLALIRLARAEDCWEVLRQTAPGLLAVAAAVAFERNLWLLVIPATDLVRSAVRVRQWAARPWTQSLAFALLALGVFEYWVPKGWRPSGIMRDWVSSVYWRESLGPTLPLDCMAPVMAAPDGTRLYTLRMWASYIIWSAHQVQVFGDGRNLEYPLELYYAGTEVWEGRSRAEEVLDSTETQMVLAYPDWNALPGLKPGAWVETLRGAHCAVFERAPDASPPVGR